MIRLRSRPGGLALRLAFFFCCASPVIAFEGIVTLPNGEPAVDASVSILGMSGMTRTDARGAFRWVPDPEPPFQILVVLRGGIYTSPIYVDALPEEGAPLRVLIASLVSESITVSAGSTPHTEAPPASAASVMTQEDLEQRRPPNLVTAVEAVPGVSRGGEGHAAVPSIRGLARGRTLLLIDGARVTTERRAGPSASYLDPFFLQAVEISRGFGSVAYGSDAFGGIIHARTREPEPGSGFQGRAQGTLGAGVPEQSAGLELSHANDVSGFILQGRYRNFDDFQSAEGDVPNSSAEDYGVRARFDREVGAGRLAVGWQSDRGRDVGRPAQPGATSFTLYPEENSDRLLLGYDADAKDGRRWAAHGFLGGYQLITQRERSTSLETTDVSSLDYGARMSGSQALGDWRLEGGLDFNGRSGLEALSTVERFDDQGESIGEESTQSIDDAARSDWAGYLSTDGRIARHVTMSAGLRLDHVTTQNRGGLFGDISTANTAASAFGALTASLGGGVTLTGQVGSGFRDPTLSDRYFQGITGRGFITGNPDLEPERSVQYDFVVRYSGRVRTALYVYHYRIRDLIERFREDGDFFYRNRGRARMQGIELEVAMGLGWGMALDVSAQLADGKALDDDSSLDDIPSEGITATLRKAFSDRGGASIRSVLRARDNDPGPNEIVNPAYVVFDLAGFYRLSRNLELRAVVNNVFDASYRRSPDDTATLAPGISAALTVGVTF